MSESHIGKKDSEETKIKKSIKLKGNKNALGYKQSQETIQKRAKQVIGRKNTPETIIKMSLIRKENKTYIIETPNKDIIKINGRENVMKFLNCSRSIFNRNGYNGYKVVGKIRNK